MKWIATLGMTVVLSFSAQAQNLLTNPGFETGNYNNWSQWQSENTTINNWGHSGSFSAAGWWQTSGWQDATIANPNLSYTVGGWIYDDVAGGESLSNGAFASLRVEFKNASDQVIGTWNTGNLTGLNLTDNAWNNFTALVTPSSFGGGITKATLVWEINNSGSGSGRGVFDDLIVQATPIPEPTGWVNLSAGLLGLLLVRHGCRKMRNESNEASNLKEREND
jgi:hypothetical protein